MKMIDITDMTSAELDDLLGVSEDERDPFDYMEFIQAPLTQEEIDRWDAEQAAEAEEKRLREANKCRRCNGTGNLGHYWYNQGGVCFSCNGTGQKFWG